MNKRPYLPVFADTFIADTIHLSDEDCAAYYRLTLLMWSQPGDGWIPELDKEIARKLGKQVRAWSRIKEHLRPLLVFDRGRISTTYVQKELGRVRGYSVRGMAGAVKRWANEEKTAEKCPIFSPISEPKSRKNNWLADSTHPHPHIKKGAGTRALPLDGQRAPARENQPPPSQVHKPSSGTAGKGPRPIGDGIQNIDSPGLRAAFRNFGDAIHKTEREDYPDLPDFLDRRQPFSGGVHELSRNSAAYRST